jgi:hypothetical protein
MVVRIPKDDALEAVGLWEYKRKSALQLSEYL